ncbi:MAG: 2-amino-3,7-dideoxy-D-threo-hept-6-ulosonate synthase [Sedimentisphaerales bacterium]|jgi:predicted phospho-2-dehydro-3-deoxyheptonate aldolase
MIGKKIRLERIMDRNSGKTVIIPMDHGVTVGPIQGLEDMREAVSAVVAGGANAILMHKGIVRAGHRGTGHDVGLIIHLSGGTSLSPDPNAKELVCTVEEAIQLGADAVSVHINIGAETDKDMLSQLGFISKRCMQWQMPLIAMMYTRGPKIKNEFDVVYVKHAARIGAELGADIVKVPYTGSVESFKEVVRGCPALVVIAGGPKMDSDEDIFRLAEAALAAGAAGLSIGRNAFQHKTPEKMVAALCEMVHKGASVNDAMQMLKA